MPLLCTSLKDRRKAVFFFAHIAKYYAASILV